jgi:hypothetical protein
MSANQACFPVSGMARVFGVQGGFLRVAAPSAIGARHG